MIYYQSKNKPLKKFHDLLLKFRYEDKPDSLTLSPLFVFTDFILVMDNLGVVLIYFSNLFLYFVFTKKKKDDASFTGLCHVSFPILTFVLSSNLNSLKY